ncbi:MAG: hypothetical protein ACO2ZI_09920, partial [Paracoccaceae bacterium]
MGCRLMRAGLLAFALFGAEIPAWADQAGVFDLYVLAFSWNSNWCAIDACLHLRGGHASLAPHSNQEIR